MTSYHNTPSVKRITSYLGVTVEVAKQVKAVMDGKPRDNQYKTRMERIDTLIGTHGVEFVRGRLSTSFCYCNAGDPYKPTVVKIGDRFRLAAWGDIVERGSYE